MFGFIIISLISFIYSVLSIQLIELSPKINQYNGAGSSTDCVIGDSVSSDCLECNCNGKWYSCSQKPCVKDVSSPEYVKETCQPNMIYVLNSTTCICSSNGKWTHELCSKTFGYVPPENIVPKSCEADSYIIIDCNVCKCNSSGKIDTTKCTRNVCEKQSRRTSTSIDKVYGNCVSQNWYSFAPCQFCYCVNANKLVCNTGSKRSEEEITLGTYKLTVCGPHLLKDAYGLVPDSIAQSQSLNPAKHLRGNELQTSLDSKKTIQDSINDLALNLNQPLSSSHKGTTPSTIHIAINSDLHSLKSANTKFGDDSSDSDEKKPKTIPVKQSTELPYYDDDVVSSESNEIEISVTEKTTTSGASKSRNKVTQGAKPPAFLTDITNKGSYQINLEDPPKSAPNSKDNTLRINFPMVLDKILNMALRKSNVKLDTVNHCEPGATTKEDCNVCFCLVNGKMLCTDKDCSSHSS